MTPNDVLDTDSTTAKGASGLAVDGNNNTYWIASQFTDQTYVQ